MREIQKITNQYYLLYIQISQFEAFLRTYINHKMVKSYGDKWHKNIIMKDLIKLMDPKYIEVWGKFTPRGGISIDPYTNYGKPGTMWEKVAMDRLVNHDLYPEKVDNR